MKRFTFHNPGKMVFGEGGAGKVAASQLVGLGVSRALLVTDEVMAKTEAVAKVKKGLGAMLAASFERVVPDTGIEIIEAAIAQAREAKADAVVSVGGGSSIDTAKAVAAALGNPGTPLNDLIGFFKLAKPPITHVAIPTTAGTGSEATCMAVIKDRVAHKKLLMLDFKLIPQVGVLDPTLTVTMPPAITAATGMDAFTHAAESIMSASAMPPADALAIHAIGLILEHLPQAVAKGDDLAARGMMLIASTEAGQAFTNAYVGVVHAMAHALGGLHGVPHGLANGMLLAVGMEFNAAVAPDRVATIGRAMGLPQTGDVQKDAAAAVQAVKDLAARVGIPARLSEVGVKPSDLEAVAALALTDGAFSTNIRKTEDPNEILALLLKCS